MTIIPGAKTFLSEPPPKKFTVSELGVIFWGLTPVFGPFLVHWRVRRATTLNFGPISTKLGGIVRAIKKMTQKDNGPGPGRNHGETGVFTFGRKVVFGLKNGFYPKKITQNDISPLEYLGKGTFFLWTTFPVVARTWLGYRSESFFLAQNFGFWSKKTIFAIQPQFWSMTHFNPRHDG